MISRVYAINLDRSRSRWERLSQSASETGVPLARVPAVDGKAVPEAARVDVSEAQFRTHSGRSMQPGEYGCYRSHLLALETFLAEGGEAAIIAEDDIEFLPDTMARAQALLEALPQAEVIKLVNHRWAGFRPRAKSALGDRIGRCLHGPQGSAACYLVTKSGAAKLLATMRPMMLPYDIELERGWNTGAATFTADGPLVRFGPLREDTEIATRREYRQVRLKPIARIPTHLFRAYDYLHRMFYCFQP